MNKIDLIRKVKDASGVSQNDVDKVIWLDVDTIVCDSIAPLWEIPLEGKWIAWCREWCGSHRPFGNLPYYNIGVCVLNLAQMREDGVTKACVDELNTNRYWCTDQDVMNLITPRERWQIYQCGITNRFAAVKR